MRRRAALEAELKTLRAAADDAMARFDDALGALAARRGSATSEVVALERRVLALQAGVEDAAAAGPDAERDAIMALAGAKERHGALLLELAEVRGAAEQLAEAVGNLAAEERTMDRGLKREFAEGAEGAYQRLAQLYKTRLCAAVAAPSAGAAGGAPHCSGSGAGAGPVFGDAFHAVASAAAGTRLQQHQQHPPQRQGSGVPLACADSSTAAAATGAAAVAGTASASGALLFPAPRPPPPRRWVRRPCRSCTSTHTPCPRGWTTPCGSASRSTALPGRSWS